MKLFINNMCYFLFNRGVAQKRREIISISFGIDAALFSRGSAFMCRRCRSYVMVYDFVGFKAK